MIAVFLLPTQVPPFQLPGLESNRLPKKGQQKRRRVQRSGSSQISLRTVKCGCLSPFPEKDYSSASQCRPSSCKGSCWTFDNSFFPHSRPFPIVAPFTLDHVQEVRTCCGLHPLLTKVVGVGVGKRARAKILFLSPPPLPSLLSKVFCSTVLSLATCNTSLSFPSLILSRVSVLPPLFSLSLLLFLFCLPPRNPISISRVLPITSLHCDLGVYPLQLRAEPCTHCHMFISYERSKGRLDFLGHGSEGVWVTGSKRSFARLKQRNCPIGWLFTVKKTKISWEPT